MSALDVLAIAVVAVCVYNVWERWLESKECIARINSEWADEDGQWTVETEETVTKENV